MDVKKDNYPDGTSHTLNFVATSTDDQVDLPFPKSLCLLIVRGSVVPVFTKCRHAHCELTSL